MLRWLINDRDQRKKKDKYNKQKPTNEIDQLIFACIFVSFFFAHFTRLFILLLLLAPLTLFYCFNYHLRNFQWWFDSKKRWLAQNTTEIGFQLLCWLQTKSLYTILFCISCVAEAPSSKRKSLDSIHRGEVAFEKKNQFLDWPSVPAVTPAPYLITPNSGFFRWNRYRKSYTFPSVSVFSPFLSSSLRFLSFTRWFLFHYCCFVTQLILPCYGLVYCASLDHNWTPCLWELDRSDVKAVTTVGLSNWFVN